MKDSLVRLRTLRVGDAMSTKMLNIDASASMDQAARTLCQHDHSAAPAVDEQGRCVGILSATDFLKRESQFEASWLAGEVCEIREERGEPLRVERRETDYVRDYMTTTLQTVAPDTSLMRAAEIMRSMHVHRLPVLDHEGRPIGMVTSMDIVSALLNVVDEMDIEQINRARQ